MGIRFSGLAQFGRFERKRALRARAGAQIGQAARLAHARALLKWPLSEPRLRAVRCACAADALRLLFGSALNSNLPDRAHLFALACGPLFGPANLYLLPVDRPAPFRAPSGRRAVKRPRR